ncbi:MAG TPA: diguanylate cyclase [Cyanobacteria bacterium UBA8803]|nr:diguanylate cyclase [Cyanobacteria bacterium UBA9273]HBL61768.1 diguanylate cyclase [Cyanobacteria bacterium UBA8803]
MQLQDLPLSSVALQRAIDYHPLMIAPETFLVDAIALMSQELSHCPWRRDLMNSTEIVRDRSWPVTGVGMATLALTQNAEFGSAGWLQTTITLPGNGSGHSESGQDWYKLSPDSTSIWNQARASYVLVMEENQLVGLLTERDLIRLAACGMNLEQLRAADVMTRNAIALKQSDFQDIFTVLNLFERHRLRHLPILNDDGQLVGVITPDSICKALCETLQGLEQQVNQQQQLIASLKAETTDRQQAQEILRQVNETLEMRVQERTAQLSNLNEQLEQEISERQGTQDALQREFDILARVMETSPVGIVMVNPQGQIVLASDQAERVLGLTKQEMGQRRYNSPEWRIADCEGNSLLDEELPFQQVMKAGQPLYNMGHAIERADGRRILLSVNGAPLFDETGELKGVVFAIDDVTDRTRAEQELRETKEQLEVILQGIADGISVLDGTGQLIYVNDIAARTAGYSSAVAMLQNSPSQGWFDQFKIMDESGQLFPIAQLPETVALQGIETSAQTLCMLDLATGEERWSVVKATPIFDEYRKVRFVVVVTHDITERKQAEQALLQLNEELTGWVSELRTRNREMGLLGEMSDFLQACLTQEEAYGAIAALVEPLFPGTSGGVFTINASKHWVEAVATWGTSLSSQVLFTPNECWALRRGRVHVVNSTQSGLLCPHVHHDPSPTQSLCVPMIARGQAMGILYLSSPKPGQLTEAKQSLAVTVAEHLALSLSNLKLHETLSIQSIRDPLTGLFNRRYMEESLERELHRAQRKKQPMGIAMLDIDHFKQFNDTFGHEAGDAVLRTLGQFLQRNIRASDIVCRYGGEELLLILPEASLKDTTQRAEEIRQGVKCLNVEHRHQSLGAITVSLGVASFPDNGVTGEALIAGADAALYRAKAEGRDRVVTAGEEINVRYDG